MPTRKPPLQEGTPNRSGAEFRYNAASHPMAFQKASAVTVAKVVKRDRPDVEDAFEDDDELEGIEDAVEEQEGEEEDISKDKMIREKTGKGKGKASAPAKKTGKGKK